MIFIIMARIIITTRQLNLLKEHIVEDVSPSQVNRDETCVSSVINKQRNVGFLSVYGPQTQKQLNRILDAGLGVIKFRQDSPYSLALVFYNHGHEKQAQELANIAMKYGGYLPCAPDQGIT